MAGLVADRLRVRLAGFDAAMELASLLIEVPDGIEELALPPTAAAREPFGELIGAGRVVNELVRESREPVLRIAVAARGTTLAVSFAVLPSFLRRAVLIAARSADVGVVELDHPVQDGDHLVPIGDRVLIGGARAPHAALHVLRTPQEPAQFVVHLPRRCAVIGHAIVESARAPREVVDRTQKASVALVEPGFRSEERR